MVFSFCSRSRSAKCLPLPQETDIVTKTLERTAQNYEDWDDKRQLDGDEYSGDNPPFELESIPTHENTTM